MRSKLELLINGEQCTGMTRYYKIIMDGQVVAIGTSDHPVENEITKEGYEALLEEINNSQ